jgi:predicted Zn finger-like uncharacterized protein
MILECTQCRTRYLVPDSAIGADGRTVRCASCKHSWFQPGVVLDLVERAEVPAAPRSAAPPAAVPPVAEPVSPPSPPPPPPPPPSRVEPAYASDDDDDYDAFAHRAPFRPRRNPARQWTMVAVAAGVAMLVGVGVLLYSDAPGIASRLGFALTPAETPLTLVANKLDRRDLLSGSQLFAVSGKVVNPTDARQSVPDIRAELRDAQGRLVYSWTIRPEATTLPPRGTVEFNSAKLDVPVNSKKLALSFADEAPR